jgi:site-specific recombinase XerD
MNEQKLSPILQRFFTDRLFKQLDASPHTVASYRDTFRLLLLYSKGRLEREPSCICIEDFSVSFLVDFLEDLEINRKVSVRTRNNRLAAIRSFFRYVSFNEPSLSLLCQRVLSIPNKRYARGPVEYLNENETESLFGVPDTDTVIGRRDKLLLVVAAQTGLRNSEIRLLRQENIQFGSGAHIRCFGKGRKTRCTPLRAETAISLNEWIQELGGAPADPVFPSSRGGALSADAIQQIVSRHVASTCLICPSLKGRSITPHTLRHTAAMSLLRNGVDLSVIALWLGHESTETTQIYLHADMEIKKKALKYMTEDKTVPKCYSPSDELISFLEDL